MDPLVQIESLLFAQLRFLFILFIFFGGGGVIPARVDTLGPKFIKCASF